MLGAGIRGSVDMAAYPEWSQVLSHLGGKTLTKTRVDAGKD